MRREIFNMGRDLGFFPWGGQGSPPPPPYLVILLGWVVYFVLSDHPPTGKVDCQYFTSLTKIPAVLSFICMLCCVGTN